MNITQSAYIITNFEDHESEKDLVFNAGGSNSSVTISLPHDCYVDYATMNITHLPNKQVNNTYPIDVQVDVGKDYTIDWAFNGAGYGPMGHQTYFEDESISKEIIFINPGSSINNTLLPKSITVKNAFLDVDTSITRSLTYDKVIKGNASDWEIGQSVASAGDVNGDGFSDIIYGTYYSGNNNDTYLYYGSSAGIGSTPNRTLSGTFPQSDFGYVVSPAGDVNNDGYDDVLVNNKAFNDYTGKVRIYHGSQNGISMTPSTTLIGEATFNHFGYSMSPAGDVNADGYSDVIISSAYYNTWQGRAYIYYGSSSGITSGNKKILTGETTGDRYGCSVAGGGDINGDGYDDVIISADYYPDGEQKGKVYIHFGSSSGISTTPSQTISTDLFDALGKYLALAGDVNGDGYSDIIFSRQNHMIDLYCGSASGVGTAPNSTLIVDWETYRSLASTGDFDNDGFDDILIGSPGVNSQTGQVELFFGSMTGPGNKITFPGALSGDYFGQSVSTAGDVDNDGFDEILIGAKGADSTRGNVIIKSILGAVNTSIQIGKNDINIWSNPYTLNEKVTTTDFSNKLNQVIQSAIPDIIDEYNNSLCRIPINITSEKGIINISNLNITYDYTAQTQNFANALNNYLKTHQNKVDENGNISIPIKVTTSLAGIVKLNGLFITINEPPYLKMIPSTYSLDEDSKVDNLIDLCDYFDDDFDSDNDLIFNVIENNVSSIIEASIYDSHYLKIDALTGTKNDNWNGKIGLKVNATDTKGLTRNSNLFTVTIEPVNDPPIWNLLPDIYLDEDTNKLNALDLKNYATDIDNNIEDLLFSVVLQNNTEDVNAIINENKNIDIYTETENYYGFVEAIIRVDDGDFYVDTGLNLIVNSINDAPKVINPIDYVKIDEDCYNYDKISLYTIFDDVDNNKLEFKVEGNKNIEIDLFEGNGTVILKPNSNWNGQEQIDFIAMDLEYETPPLTIEIKVNPVNDPPNEPEIISPSSHDIFTNIELIDFIGTGDDIDLYDNNSFEKLNYTWISNVSGIIGYSENLFNITLPAGTHQIELIVQDSFKIENSTSFILDIQDVRSNVYGNVTDNNGILLNDVIISCYSKNGIYYNTTTKNGSYSILLFPGIYNISANKNGYIYEIKNNYSISEKTKLNLDFKTVEVTDNDLIPDNVDDKDDKKDKSNTIIFFIIFVIIIIVIIILFLFVVKPKLMKMNEKDKIGNKSPEEPQRVSTQLEPNQISQSHDYQFMGQQGQYQTPQYFQQMSPQSTVQSQLQLSQLPRQIKIEDENKLVQSEFEREKIETELKSLKYQLLKGEITQDHYRSKRKELELELENNKT